MVVHPPPHCSDPWLTKPDRINPWLLQNLVTLLEEAKRHRAFILNGKELGEEQWVRLVLKFWQLNDAAPMFALEAGSTNDAVNSAGAAHSSSIMFVEMPFDIGSEDQIMEVDPLPLQRKRDVMPDCQGSDLKRTTKKKKVKWEIEDLYY